MNPKSRALPRPSASALAAAALTGATLAAALVIAPSGASVPSGKGAGASVPGASVGKVNAASALSAYVVRYGGNASVSPIVVTSAGALVAAVGTSSPKAPSEVLILQFKATSWAPVAVLGASAHLPLSLGADTPVLAAHLTGQANTDFFATFAGADYTASVVASNVGGTWHLAGFRNGKKGLSPSAPNAAILGRYVVSSTNNCVPNCAAGKITNFTYLYQTPQGAFVYQGS